MTGDTIDLAPPSTRHARRVSRISYGAIIVSFSHMAGALALYSGQSWWDRIVSAGMVLIVDLALWSLAEYLLYCRQIGRPAHAIVPTMFGLAVVTSISLNALAIWAHRPAETVAPWQASALVAVVFAVLISGFIVAAAVIAGETLRDGERAQTDGATLAELRRLVDQLTDERDGARAQLLEAESARQRLLPGAEAAPTLQLELATAQRRVVALEAEVRVLGPLAEQARSAAPQLAELARSQADAAHRAQEIARLEREVAQHRATGARLEETTARQVRDLEEQLRDARAIAAAAAHDPRTLVRTLRAELGEAASARALARVFNVSDSTVRGWLKEGAA